MAFQTLKSLYVFPDSGRKHQGQKCSSIQKQHSQQFSICDEFFIHQI